LLITMVLNRFDGIALVVLLSLPSR